MRIVIALFALALVIAASTAGSSQAAAMRLDVSGDYTSNWGRVTLHQHGARVTGDYVYQHGVLEGVIEGNVVSYRWTEGDAKGRGVFVVASNGQLIGTWGVGEDDLGGGGWRLVPMRPGMRPGMGQTNVQVIAGAGGR